MYFCNYKITLTSFKFYAFNLKNMKIKFIIFISISFLLLLVQSNYLLSQSTTQSPSSFDFNANGIVFETPDSLMEVRMRFRMQNQMLFQTESEEDMNIENSQLAVRRLRLRFGGHLYDKNLTYNLQLSFSRGDIDFSNTGFPNIIRDAMIFYNFNKNFQLSFGQTKLPGNRQRVVSSSDMQFAERSIVNNLFTLDRDFGVQGWHGDYLIGNVYYNLRGAITDGEGRNAELKQGPNYSYTARAEVLPFGKFKNGGDYIESDMEFEETPKLSIGVSANKNKKTQRAGGQLGAFLYSPVSLETYYADALFKYNGISLYGEYATRHSIDNPITTSSDNKIRYAFEGDGFLFQGAYLFKNMYEVAARYAEVHPTQRLQGFTTAEGIRNISIAGSKYIYKHRAKIQFEVTYVTRSQYNLSQGQLPFINTIEKSNLQFIINMELGI